MSYNDLQDDFSQEEIDEIDEQKEKDGSLDNSSTRKQKKSKEAKKANKLVTECMSNLTFSTKSIKPSVHRPIGYDEELVEWFIEQEELMREEQESRREQQELECELTVPIKGRNYVSPDTSYARKKKNRKHQSEAQLFVTGTLDKSKKNKKYNKMYSTYTASSKDADKLPRNAQTLAARREHRKREINLARLEKTRNNTAGPTPSEQQESQELEAEQYNDYWYSYDAAHAAQDRLGNMYNYMCYEFDSDFIDMCEHMRVGEMMGREHLANVNSSYCDYW
jgi:hypothetical protein